MTDRDYNRFLQNLVVGQQVIIEHKGDEQEGKVMQKSWNLMTVRDNTGMDYLISTSPNASCHPVKLSLPIKAKTRSIKSVEPIITTEGKTDADFYNEGYKANQAAIPLIECPYDLRVYLQAWKQWEAGWLASWESSRSNSVPQERS